MSSYRQTKNRIGGLGKLIGSMLLWGMSLTALADGPEGNWVSPCTALVPGAVYVNTTLTANQGAFQYHIRHYYDSGCQLLQSEMTSMGQYVVGNPVFYPGSYEINWITSSLTIVAATPEAAAALNRDQWCGFDDWLPNEAKSVMETTCGLGTGPVAGDVEYDIFMILNNHLYYGRVDQFHDGLTPETRPVEINQYFSEILAGEASKLPMPSIARNHPIFSSPKKRKFNEGETFLMTYGTEATQLMERPTLFADVAEEVSPGTLLEVHGRIGTWLKVKIDEARDGWVRYFALARSSEEASPLVPASFSYGGSKLIGVSGASLAAVRDPLSSGRQ